ncbi:MAG: NAD-dependent epimerase/dehydratase family protein [Metallosphaera yellowstonensis]|uniref:Nucleoside-diphosphate-sugar epimerase n=1 Tax=Metallosphaera yellowstonensis MK1 TaxID=671065 RepID=H2C9N7_9CREN|nr:NAD-dependent epimerase/dehydratase family protein [Metallosphaera yellowstonensis]EHP68863.1 nucleoside-diphosphate-sugar epimerase [Metallosphaera yellowstonensis MK1]
MKYLVTGGAGFLGSHLIEALEGEVTVVDDMSTAKYYYFPPKVKLVKGRIEEVDVQGRFDYVIHLAARPSPEDYMRYPVETALSNSLGTYKALEIARRNDATFLYTSSSEVYGHAEVIPTPEEYWGKVNPTGVRSCYDESKRFSEALAMSYYREYGLDVRIQRPFNVYGPRLREDGTYGRVVSRFVVQALRGEDLTVFGDGSQTRAFLYVDDWVDATLRMLRENVKGEVFNIGSDREVKILDLARTIISLTGSRSGIKFLPPRVDDPPRRAADITKARRRLGWEPRVSLEEGLRKTVEWFRGVLG